MLHPRGSAGSLGLVGRREVSAGGIVFLGEPVSLRLVLASIAVLGGIESARNRLERLRGASGSGRITPGRHAHVDDVSGGRGRASANEGCAHEHESKTHVHQAAADPAR